MAAIIPVLMNAAKAKALLQSLHAAAITPTNPGEGATDPLVAWLSDADNGAQFGEVVAMMRTGDAAIAMLSLFQGVHRADDMCDPWSNDPGNAYPRWRRTFVDAARKLLDELAELESPQPRLAGAVAKEPARKPSEQPELLNVAQAVALLGVKETHLIAMERKKQCPPRKPMPSVVGTGKGLGKFVRAELLAFARGEDWRTMVEARLKQQERDGDA